MIHIQERTIYINENVRKALQKLNYLSELYIRDPLALFVLDRHDRCIGSLTDGDIRRHLLEHHNIDEPVSCFMNTQFHYLQKDCFNLLSILSSTMQVC